MIFNRRSTQQHLIIKLSGSHAVFLGQAIFAIYAASLTNANLMRKTNDLGILVSGYFCPEKIFKYKRLSSSFYFCFRLLLQ